MKTVNDFERAALTLILEMICEQGVKLVLRYEEAGHMGYFRDIEASELLLEVMFADDIALRCPNDDLEVWEFFCSCERSYEKDYEEMSEYAYRFLTYTSKAEKAIKYVAFRISNED